MSETPPKASSSQAVYFANEKDDAKFAAGVFERIERYETYVFSCGLFDLWSLSYRFWYSQDEEGFTAHRIGKKGPKGKYAVLKMNHYRSIVKNWRSLAQAQRADTQPVAKHSGSDSDRQVKRAQIVLDHFDKAADIGALKDEAIDISSYLGAAHLEQVWMDDAGELVLPTDIASLLNPNGDAPPAVQQPHLGAMNPVQPQAMPALGAGQTPPSAEGGAPGVPDPKMGPPGLMTVDQSGQTVPAQAEIGAKPEENNPFEKKEIRTGSIESEVYSPIDFITDPERMNHRGQWCVTRKYRNKWDVAARYARNQEEFDKIIALERPRDEKLRLSCTFVSKELRFPTDDIPVYTFWHEKTPAMPGGCYAVLLSRDLVFKRQGLGKLPSIPVQRIAPGNIRRTPFGYTEAWDLLAPQQAADILSSISLSNMRTFGAGNIITPKNSGLKSTAVTEGLNLLEYNQMPGGAKPEVLAMPQTPPEVPNSRRMWVGEMGTLIGVNSVARGDPEKSLESGSALALVQAQAVQYSSDYQNEIIRFQGAVDTDTVWLTQVNLKHEYEFAVVGQEMASLDKFAGKDVDGIMRVDIKPVNPMTKTMSGRWQMATFLASTYPQQVTPDQLIHMIGNGTLNPITEDTQTEARNILRENELLLKGIGPVPKTPVIGPDGQPVIDMMTGQPKTARQAQPGKQYVRALITDNASRHVIKHKALLDSPAARENPAIYTAVLDHLEEHEEQYAFLTSGRPGLLQMLNLPPMQAALPGGPESGMGPGGQMPPPGAGGPPGGGPGGPPPQGGGVRPSPEGKEAPPDGGGAAKMPQFPKNPASGDRYTPPAPPGG